MGVMRITISNPQMVLRPQDLLVLLRLSLCTTTAPTYAKLAEELGLTSSETHAAVKRSIIAQLAYKDARNKPVVIREALKLFITHGARYCFPAIRGSMARGVPTCHSAQPIKELVVASANEPPTVWPHPKGTARGISLIPFYPSVPEAALRNPALYELLVAFDAIRAGTMRERALGITIIEEKLNNRESKRS